MNDKMNPIFHQQAQWFELVKKCGSEKAAEEFIVKRLRHIADIIESGNYPKVYGCCIDGDENDLMCGVLVTLSHPWPG